MATVEHLTRVAQDYLKVIWSAVEWGDPPIATKALAERFGTTTANVSETMRRLAAQGLVVYVPYKPVRLTRQGEMLAVAMIRRHRLIETFLAHTLGYTWDEVHDEAERLEHAVSDTFLARIDTLLRRPRFDPHGDQIPLPDGGLVAPRVGARLAQATPGHYRVVRVADDDGDLLARLAARGLVPPVRLEVLGHSPADGTTTVVADGARHILTDRDADAVRLGDA